MKIQEQINLLSEVLKKYLVSVYDEKSNSLKLDIKDRNTIERLDVIMFYLSKSNYKANKKISNAMLNILDWFERYPDIVKNITQA